MITLFIYLNLLRTDNTSVVWRLIDIQFYISVFLNKDISNLVTLILTQYTFIIFNQIYFKNLFIFVIKYK